MKPKNGKPTPATPTKEPEPTPTDVLGLFLKNLDEIKRWHRNASIPGRVVGYMVTAEHVFTLTVEALQLAREGKQWSPGSRTP